jgi:hypothetical protein
VLRSSSQVDDGPWIVGQRIQSEIGQRRDPLFGGSHSRVLVNERQRCIRTCTFVAGHGERQSLFVEMAVREVNSQTNKKEQCVLV